MSVVFLFLLGVIAGLTAIARINAPFVVWSAVFGALLMALSLGGWLAFLPGLLLWTLFLLIVVPLNVPAWRQRFLSQPSLALLKRGLPAISETEREALDAGNVWWEADLFRGNPDWAKLRALPAPVLTAEEQAFLDGPVEEVCRRLNDWRITHELNDLPAEIWETFRRERFFGMVIPKEFGGLGFSPVAHSAVVMKIASRSGTAAVTAMVPNSLGPAELLLHYGTEEQKNHYLLRLARGEEIPCFALTGPTAGSDAAAMPDYGIVTRAVHAGREVLGLRVNWDKRYITLAPVATLIGLAFRVYDPQRLLGGVEDLGITCALVPADTPGVEIGRRHYPLNASFQNGPTRGRDVFIPLDSVIGGREGVGRGWRMLMESLAAGRGISLPALSVAAVKQAARTAGAYARVREQFGLPIGRFEGVEEALARIGGLAYLLEAGRSLTIAALAAGERPAVVSAIVKYQLTEGSRVALNDAMDIHGGRGICLGPSNYLARGYQQLPIGITVEGANILTRSLIVFGQGALRCHPFLRREMDIARRDDEHAPTDFDALFFAHLGYSFRNAARAFVYGLSAHWLAPAGGEPAAHYRAVNRYAAAFALLADVSLVVLGAGLKRSEKLSGRFADALAQLYLAGAALWRFNTSGRPEADRPLLDWALAHTLQRAEEALDGILRNFPNRALALLLRVVVFPFGRRRRGPADALGRRIAELMMTPGEARERLTRGIFVSTDANDLTGRLEAALQKTVAAETVRRKLKEAGYAQPPHTTYEAWLQQLVARGALDETQRTLLQSAQEAQAAAVRVDDFPPS